MADGVELRVSSDFSRIVADLEGLKKKSLDVNKEIQRVSDDLDKNLNRASKNTEKNLEGLRVFGARLADQMRGYFSDIARSAAAGLESVKKDLGLKQQFKEATAGAVELYDTIRKLGATLGITQQNAVGFQKSITSAFSQYGLSQDDAANALEGLSRTQVRGESNLLNYGTTAANLGVLGDEKGSAGEIAKALADTLQARGQDANDTSAMRQLADDVRRTTNATGSKPTEVLANMQGLYGGMAGSSRDKMGSGGLRNLAAVESVVGKDFESLVKELTSGNLKKLPLEMQGLGGLVSDKGFDFDKLDKIKGIGNRIGFDKEASFETAGLSPEAARAMVRLIQQSDAARAAQDRANTNDGATIEGQAASSRGLGENVKAVKDRVQNAIGGAISPVLGMANDVLQQAAGSDAGSAIAMGAGYAGAAAGVLGAGALAKKFGGKGGGLGNMAGALAKGNAIEQITGQKTTPVYVVNVSEFGSVIGGGAGAGAAGGAVGKLAGAAEKLAGAAAAFTVGLAIGDAINTGVLDKMQIETKGYGKGNPIEQFMHVMMGKEGSFLDRATDLANAIGGLNRNTGKQVEQGKLTAEREVRKDFVKPSNNRSHARGASNAVTK